MAGDTTKGKSDSVTGFTAFLDRYGPYGFGVASLLLIWFAIVQPELARSKTDYTEFNKGAELLESTSRTMENTAVLLGNTTERLEVITQQQRELSREMGLFLDNGNGTD